MKYSNIPLPRRAHLPGANARPSRDWMVGVAQLALPTTRSSNAADNVAWHYGIDLINHGFFWEAHEVLESVWGNAVPNSRERFLIQALIHVANARLKWRQQLPRAATRLAAKALESMHRAYPAGGQSLMGIEPQTALGLARGCNDADATSRIALLF